MTAETWTTGTPAERLAVLRNAMLEAHDAFMESWSEERDAKRKRYRALDAMQDIRGRMMNLAAEHGLELPPLRWSALLESDDA